MTGIVRCKLVGFENRSYKRKADGRDISGRNLYFMYENDDPAASGAWVGSCFTSDPQALTLMLDDDIFIFRDDWNRQRPCVFVPRSE